MGARGTLCIENIDKARADPLCHRHVWSGAGAKREPYDTVLVNFYQCISGREGKSEEAGWKRHVPSSLNAGISEAGHRIA